MNDIRSYASLSGSLLARKGGAKPAMRPRAMGPSPALEDDLGWDDMGYAVEQPAEHVPSSIAALTPAPKAPTPRDEQPPVHMQQRALAESFGDPEPAPEPHLEAAPEAESSPPPQARRAAAVVALPTRPAAAPGRKAAFTLRLDPARHLRLRLATAVTGKSAQQLVTGALDLFLESLPEVGTMADQLPARSGKRS